jgi:hypothetical protein
MKPDLRRQRLSMHLHDDVRAVVGAFMKKTLLLIVGVLSVAWPGFVLDSHAITITGSPTLATTTNAPLACKLILSTDVDSRISVAVDDGIVSWTRDFYDYDTAHSLILAGFKADRTNQITVTVHDKFRNQVTYANPLVFTTTPLPSNFPHIVLNSSQPDKMEPGYTLFRAQNTSVAWYDIIVDNQGEVVWYSPLVSDVDVRQLPDGNLFAFTSTSFFEFNLFGDKLQTWSQAPGWSIDQHDGYPTDHGTILYLSPASRTVTNFPGSATISNAPTHTVTVTHYPVVEISATNSALLNVWSIIDMINPRRVTYFYNGGVSGVDWEHANAVIEDPRDGGIIVSMRHQNAIIKFDRTGQLKWILGSPENFGPPWDQYLLTPVGTPFRWSFAQHAPKVTPQGTLLVYDDGNFRANPFNPSVADASNFTRGVEYSINEDTLEISQVWEYGEFTSERLYTPSVGNIAWLPKTGNIAITFANVTYVNGVHPSPYSPGATMMRIKEVTHEQPAEVVFDLQLFDNNNTSSTYSGCMGYRSDRIPDLYASQPAPVEDLTANYLGDTLQLQFSANPARTYSVEASTDLVQWEAIGTPVDDLGNGEFNFDDEQSVEFPTRYYRVVSLP